MPSYQPTCLIEAGLCAPARPAASSVLAMTGRVMASTHQLQFGWKSHVSQSHPDALFGPARRLARSQSPSRPRSFFCSSRCHDTDTSHHVHLCLPADRHDDLGPTKHTAFSVLTAVDGGSSAPSGSFSCFILVTHPALVHFFYCSRCLSSSRAPSTGSNKCWQSFRLVGHGPARPGSSKRPSTPAGGPHRTTLCQA